MKRIVFFLILSLPLCVLANTPSELFTNKCAACHTIGKGRLVGPDLKNISELRDNAWLLKFIRSSQTFINSGDADAVKVYNEYNKLLMPDALISDSEITEILNYIKEVSSGNIVESTQVIVDPLAETNDDNIVRGRKLFNGQNRLENHGASCLSCHHVKDDLAYPGGNLAKELTESYEVMGGAGVIAIIRNSPFPAMAQAYQEHALTESEVIDLGAYLKSVSEKQIYQHPRDYSLTFLYLGQLAFLLFLGAILAAYWKRKKETVNQKIFDRQSSSK
jgi:mono/diheme cytochrome c family protein